MKSIDETFPVTERVAAGEAVAVVGVGAVMPDAPDADAFFGNVESGRYSIRQVPADRWKVESYYDPDPAAPDKSYCKIGSFVTDFAFDFKRFRIPPRTVESMDLVQQWAMSAAGEALSHAGYLDRDFDHERTAVIIGNSMAGELHYSTSLRVLVPEVTEALQEDPAYRELPEAVRRRILEGLVSRLDGRLPRVTEDSMPGELSNVISGRVANAFNLGGASYTVDAACASSLAAIDTAVNGLRRREYDLVLTGGVDRSMSPPTFVKFCKIGALSPDGSYPFDERAGGFVMGEGCAMFVLKRWADAVRDGDEVLALILGIGSSSDGRGKGIAAPNRAGQLRALRRAYQVTGISPADIDVIEAHGTSTRVGDPVEVEALSTVFAEAGLERGRVALGSVKSQIGHLKSAAGAAALLKMSLAMHRRTIPPNVNYERPNPAIDFARTPFRVPLESEPWHNGRPRRAGISAFGFGGTNFHVVMQEPPVTDGPLTRTYGRGASFTESTMGTNAREGAAPAAGGDVVKDLLERVWFMTASSREDLLERLRAGRMPERLGDLSAVERAGREPCRLAVAAASQEDLAAKVDKLRAAAGDGLPERKAKVLERQGVVLGEGEPMGVAFLFPGQGSQGVGMLGDLYAGYASFRSAFDEADEVMRPILGHGLSDVVYPRDASEEEIARLEERLKQTEVTQPAMLAADTAMARLLAEAGVRPDMVVGHSLGEYAALMSAGVLDMAAAMEIVAARGREMTSVSLSDPGRMVAAMADAETVERLIEKVDGYLVPANKNSSMQTVVAGESAAIAALLEVFEAEGVRAVPLRVSHAFHSRIVAPASEPLRRVLSRHEFRPARIPVFTNVGGGAYPEGAGRETFVDVLARQIASPVEFVACVRNMYEAGARLFVEVGPRRVLASFAEDVLEDAGERVRVTCANNHRSADMDALAAMWAAAAASGAVRAGDGASAASLNASGPGEGGERGSGRETGGRAAGRDAEGVVVSGTALGLPGRRSPVFTDEGVQRLLEGTNFLEPVADEIRETFTTLNLQRIDRGTGEDLVESSVTDESGAIKLSGQSGSLDLPGDYGIDRDLASTMDATARMAVAAGLEALRTAGIPLVQRLHTTRTGAKLPAGWVLPEPLQDETGVIFASAFPGLDRFARELAAYYEHRLAGRPYEFDRKILFGILSMGHTQMAQAICARGPNTQVNSACASTSVAVATATDWIRTGRCRRVLVVAADDASSAHLLPWVGGGFLANGAAATDEDVSEAAIPFDERRHGLLVGAGAAALVVEAEDELRARGAAPLSRIVHTRLANSAFHGSRLSSDHITAELGRFMSEVEDVTGRKRADMVDDLVFLSHETYTPARGGSADAEVAALRGAFGGEGARKVLVANTKGFTGHPMGVGFEDALAPWMLHTGRVPPIANLSRTDPLFADINLSRGGAHDPRWVLRFSAGFGSQVAMILFEKSSHGERLVVDESLNRSWLEGLLGGGPGRLEVSGRVLHLVAGEAAAGEAPAEQAEEAASAAGPPTEDLLSEVLALVAERTGYPVDMLDPDMDMEADLGIDTVKQAELFSVIRKRWGIPRQENLKLTDYPTINHVVEFVGRFATGAPAAAGAATAAGEAPAARVEEAPAARAEEAPAAAGPPTEDLLSEVLALVAERTGYPVDMLDPDMDMEADLGIDTVKQAELFSVIRKRWGIPRQENLKLTDYPTINHVVEFVGRFATGAPAAERAAPAADDDVRPRPSIPPEAVEAGAAEPAEPAGSFEARMLEPVPAWIPPSTAMGSVERTLSAGRGPVVVCGDGPLGEALRTHLAARSVTVVGAAEARSDEGAVQGVVLVDGGEALAAVPALGAHGRAVVEATTEHFELLRDLLSGGRLDPEGGFVLGITRMGGTFGLGETAPESASGGALAGLVKAYGSEHPGALAKVVDVDGRDDPDETARLLVEELEHDPMTREVGYRAGQRWGVTLEERDLPRAARPAILPERPVVMMTGGAGSIMVEIAERMASTLAARVVLTDILDPRAAEDAGAAERVLEAIERVEAAGGTALYVPADVTDEASVDRAVEEAVARFGRVDAVLHGAGMEESRALAKKSTETFRRIVSIKVAGAAHLVASVMRRARPRSFLFFSSVAGRFGNAGQADYSAGNDFMTRFAAALCERHPEVRFTAVDWTAWDGPGMAGDSAIRAVLEDAGIEVLDRAEGAEIACRVVAGRDPVGPEVVVARRLGVLEERIARAEGRTVALRPRGRHELEGSIRWSGNRLLRTFTVDPDRERWLWDHAVDGTPVFPAVMGLDAFLRTASALVGPELAAARIERSTFRRAVKFFEGKPRELRVVIEPEDAAGGDIRCSCVLDTENRNRIEGGRVIHFGAVVLLGTRPADPRPSAGSITRGEGVVIAGGGDLAGSSRDAAAAVYEHLFHGPGFQVLAGFHHGGRRFEVGVGELAGGGELAPAGVALLAEMGMQTAGMWLLRSAGLAALPAAIGTLHVLGDPSGVGPCRAVSVYRGRVDAGAEGVRHVFDVTIRDVASGRTVLWLESLALVQTTERPEARAGRPAPAGGPGAVVQDRRQ